jgi:predicted nucleotidyltransferase
MTAETLPTIRNGNGASPLSPRERRAVERLVGTVRRQVPAELVHALLFGSKARGTARPDSDVDVLLIFRVLPPDREPQATIAEEIAEVVSHEQGVPVAPWSVSLEDLQWGQRTPMLVDALEDSVPIWPAGVDVPWLPFTPQDALRCCAALLQRVEEGSDEVAHRLRHGDTQSALRRARDDLVRMCTAALLLHGETRPRYGHTVQRFLETHVAVEEFPARFLPQLRWARDSFGASGKEEDLPLQRPSGGLTALFALVEHLADRVEAERWALGQRLAAMGTPAPALHTRQQPRYRGNGR